LKLSRDSYVKPSYHVSLCTLTVQWKGGWWDIQEKEKKSMPNIWSNTLSKKRKGSIDCLRKRKNGKVWKFEHWKLIYMWDNEKFIVSLHQWIMQRPFSPLKRNIWHSARYPRSLLHLVVLSGINFMCLWQSKWLIPGGSKERKGKKWPYFVCWFLHHRWLTQSQW